MKNRKRLLVAAVVIFGCAQVFAADVRVIANQSVKADVISPRELQRVFLQENNSLSDGSHVEPVLEKDGPVHKAFLRQYMGKTNDDLQTYYRALVFTGRGFMPKELSSDAEVVAYIARTRGAIGYVSAESTTEGVKTLAIVSEREGRQRRLMTRIEPEYPETLKRLHIGGIVRLRLSVTADGNVENIQLLGGNPILAESTIAAVRQWVYCAGNSRTTTEVSFRFDPDR